MRSCMIVLFFSLCLAGCSNVTVDSTVWRAQDVSLTEYQALQVLDVFNASGRSVSKAALTSFDRQLKDHLEKKDLQIVDSLKEAENPLLVQTSIVHYERERPVIGSYRSFYINGVARESVVTLQIVLLDRVLNRRVAEIKNATIYGSGANRVPDFENQLFHQVANVAAEEITKLLRSVESQ